MVNELNELKTKLNERIEHLGSKLRNDLIKFKDEQSLQIDRVDIDKRQITRVFDFKIVDLLNKTKTNFSPIFYCQSLRWSLVLQPEKKNSTIDYIGCYLHCDNKSDCTNWSVAASYELTLLAQLPGTQDRHFSIEQHIFKRGDQGWGFQDFIRLAELIDPNNAFVKDQMIKIKVHLQTNTIIRII